MDWRVLYIIRKLLKRRCLKWPRMTHLDICNTSYAQKKGRESNWQFDSRPVKVRNWPNFVVCRCRVTRRWKALDENYNFASNLISIQGLHAKLWGPKIVGVPSLAISRLPLGSPGTKSHLDVGLVGSQRVYYKGEGGDFPQVWAVVSLVNPSCLWLVLYQKCSNYALTTLCWFCAGPCEARVSEWSLSIHPSPIPKLQHAPLPLPSATSQGACLNSLLFRCFLFGTHIWIPQGVGNASLAVRKKASQTCMDKLLLDLLPLIW